MSTPTYPPWLDLPTPMTEKILERLPLSDYVRFPAVCRQWRSIQSDHRRRHAPSRPPMLNLPWFIPCQAEGEILPCYSPFEGRSYRVPVPNPRAESDILIDGWLFRSDALINPISGVQIPLDPTTFQLFFHSAIGVVTVLPPPNFMIAVFTRSGELFVRRESAPQWTPLQLPMEQEGCETVQDVVAVGGKLYSLCTLYQGSDADHLFIIDPLHSPPAVCSYRLDSWTKTPQKEVSRVAPQTNPEYLLESDGELLLVAKVRRSESDLVLLVFKLDGSKRMWTRVESLGDRVLILGLISSCVSLLAADVGLRKNCIYLPDHRTGDGFHIWKVFDLGAETVTEVAFPIALPVPVRMDCVDVILPFIC